MTRAEDWIEQQRRVIPGDGSPAAATIVLESSDGVRVGTWRVNEEGLGAIVTAAINRYGQELPRGRHAARLAAYDAEEQQVSYHPLTITGTSEPATSHGSDALQMQRAVGVAVANFEKMSAVLQNTVDRQAKTIDDLLDGQTTLIVQLQKILSTNFEIELAQKESDQRMAMLKPVADALVQVGIPILAILAERVVQKLGNEAPAAPALPTGPDAVAPAATSSEPAPTPAAAASPGATASQSEGSTDGNTTKPAEPDPSAAADGDRKAGGAAPYGAGSAAAGNRPRIRGNRNKSPKPKGGRSARG